MTLGAAHAEQIAASAALAAWVGAAASTLASGVALSVAVWSARREEAGRRRRVADEETAFAFGMVGAFEMAKPLVAEAQARPDGSTTRRRFAHTVRHAQMIADAALGIRVYDMQMLRDGYLVRGLLNVLQSLEEGAGESVPHRSLLEVVEPVLANVMEADDRFFARLPPLGAVKGVHGRTPLARPAG